MYPDLKEELLPRINSYLRNISNRITAYGIMCTQCKEKRAFVCPHCFMEYMLDELEHIHAESFIVTEFLEFFQVVHSRKKLNKGG